jgi:uncharacterized membrane protein YidH (DUF202 family)
MTQPERTALAWRRTGLSAGVVCLVLAITLVRIDLAYLAIGAAALAVITTVLAMQHFPDGAQLTREYAWPALTRLVGVVVAVALLGVVAAVLVATR